VSAKAQRVEYVSPPKPSGRKKMKREEFDRELASLQLELVKL
jgi:hypothetical protein